MFTTIFVVLYLLPIITVFYFKFANSGVGGPFFGYSILLIVPVVNYFYLFYLIFVLCVKEKIGEDLERIIESWSR